MAWLDRRKSPVPPGPVPDGAALAVVAWNMLGGLDWAGLPIIAEILGIEDLEMLVAQLIVLRDHGRPANG